ncbi:unnamed protein product [Alternaria alternata]
MATQAVAKSLAPTPKLPDLSGETIAVQVGNEVIHVYECLISSSSEFFKNATKPEWRTESRPVDLSDEQSDISKRYCQWLYTGFIAPGLLVGNFECLAYMYVLGEKIVDHKFQNAVIQAMMSDMGRMNVAPNLETVKIIYDGTTEESVARRLFVDSYAHSMTSSWKAYKDLLKAAHKPFLNDLLPTIVEKRLTSPLPEDKPWISQPHSYHRKVAILKSDVVE